MDKEESRLKATLGSDIFNEDNTPLEVAVGALLKKKGLTLSTAESCTGGQIATLITSVPGSSVYFKGSIVAYANDIKVSLLNVSPKTLEIYGAVSEETVKEMVKGAMNSLKTDCAIAVSGIAGPDGGTKEKPTGTVWIAAAYKEQTATFLQTSDRGREQNTKRAVTNGLILLLDLLNKGKYAKVQ
ncbi:CinA family protein [Bacteroides sp. 214]|uniref:CinA family protein n=1 Tax=Bacteroides sp. 214 TaxID=2302935 RepID=UPI0013D49B00|nr:CinA family protein [Bacteroides sp. 214]NDW12958.1 CinA family protein [Bacteroides sp. 214]